MTSLQDHKALRVCQQNANIQSTPEEGAITAGSFSDAISKDPISNRRYIHIVFQRVEPGYYY
jgi:hypothetical protein